MGIVQCWNVYCTVRKNVFVFLARVRVSNQYFPVLDCVSYSCARKRSLTLAVSLWSAVYILLVLAWISYGTQEGIRVSR